MKALVSSAILASSLLMVSPAYGQDWSLHTTALKKSIFQLESNEGHCSAILVNEKEGYLLTAAHCIPEKTEGRSVAVDQKDASVVKVNSVLDLAIIKAPEIRGTAILLRKEDAEPGLPVAIVGFGFAAHRLKYGFGWVSDGRDNSLRGVGDRLYFSAAGVVGGDSGGAVVDTNGRLVSVVQGAVAHGFTITSISYGPPSEVLEDFVKSALPKP